MATQRTASPPPSWSTSAPTATTTSSTLMQADIDLIPSPNVPISPQLHYLLAEFSRLAIELFTILSQPPTQSGTAPHSSSTSMSLSPTQAQANRVAEIYESLAELDLKLNRLVRLVHAHERNQQRIDELVSRLQHVDASSKRSIEVLERGTQSLAPVVESAKLDRANMSRATEARLTARDVLSYARLLAPFTSAPPSSLFPPEQKLRSAGSLDPTGRSLPPGSIPPFPTEGIMRRGRLQFGRQVDVGSGLGQTEEIGGRANGHEGGGENGIARNGAGGGDETMERLRYEAKQYESTLSKTANGFASTNVDGEGEEEDEDERANDEEEFEFDLDLNPDL
ncbi:hypothetical protein JCM3766R1_002451 [Sporobolomyces carnicolor]